VATELTWRKAIEKVLNEARPLHHFPDGGIVS
jgi:hypothetical protein